MSPYTPGITFVPIRSMLPDEKTSLPKPAGPNDYLANERTFLAWTRTAIALMGFGFVIVKFALFIREISLALGAEVTLPHRGYSTLIGILMVALGAIMEILAFLRYHQINKRLQQGQFFPSKWLSALLTLCIVTGGILLVLYLLPGIF